MLSPVEIPINSQELPEKGDFKGIDVNINTTTGYALLASVWD